LGTNKLCMGDPTDMLNANQLNEVISSFTTLENLNLEENSLNDDKFKCIIPGIVSQKNLKSLKLYKNSLTSISMELYIKKLYEVSLETSEPQPCSLETLDLTGCIMKEKGITVIFTYILTCKSLFSNLHYLKLNANKVPMESLYSVLYFINEFTSNSLLKIDFQKQGLFGKQLE
jgi:Ran GTPase-activating protein (RanGAP) involved in mRNA processing and transport